MFPMTQSKPKVLQSFRSSQSYNSRSLSSLRWILVFLFLSPAACFTPSTSSALLSCKHRCQHQQRCHNSFLVPKKKRQDQCPTFTAPSAAIATIATATRLYQSPATANDNNKAMFSSLDEADWSGGEECNFPYTLPPVDRDLTQLEKEFRDMFTEFACYSERDIMSVESARLRALYEGVGASARDPPVYRAFEVLFEDMLPLRLAGRMIYNKLKQVMADAQVRREMQVEKIVATTGLEAREVEANRIAFLKLAAASQKESGEAELTIQQLIDTGIADTVVELLGFESFDEFLQALNKDKNRPNGSVSFAELMIALQRCSRDSGDIACQPATVLPELAKRMAASKNSVSNSTLPSDVRKQKYNADYDAMLKAFSGWEDAIPTGEGRMLDVLRGCFAGARNHKVVEALRIVYVDYSALRMAGNLIFKLMSGLIARQQRKA